MAFANGSTQFYNAVISASGGGSTVFTLYFEEEEGGLGMNQDVVADAVRDAIEAIPSLDVGTLNKHVETITTVS